MKKKLAILISFIMVLTFAFAACGGGDGGDVSSSRYVGIWTADSLSIAGESDTVEGEYTLVLNDDGTGTFSGLDEEGNEQVSNITWSLTNDGFKTKGDAKMTFKDDGDDIVTKILGVELRFVKGDKGTGGETSGSPDGASYGYAGDDPVEAACYKYMAETVSKGFEPADASIPTVIIVHEDFTPEDEVLVYGDFWVENYNIEGDTLKCIAGGNYPGCMHVSKADNTVTAFDEVADGEEFESSAKEMFGEHYDDFMAVYSNSDKRNEERKITVSDYVNLNGR